MKKQQLILVIIAVFGIILTACYKHDWEKLHPAPVVASPCYLPDTVSYSRDITPIINASCGVSGSRGPSCHEGGTSASGYDFTTYTGVASTCRHDSTSLIYTDITGTSGNLMPQGGPKLNSCDIARIIRWINQGYPNN